MNHRSMFRASALAAALALTAASAWATHLKLQDATWIPAPSIPAPPMPEPAAAPAPIVPATPPVRHTETIVDEAPARLPAEPPAKIRRVTPIEAAAIPRMPATAPQPRITIEKRRLTLDERIQADLLDRLAGAPNLSGRIGVETRGAIVTLSGWTTTSGQAQRVARYASGVRGVKDVQSEIRPRVGGSG